MSSAAGALAPAELAELQSVAMGALARAELVFTADEEFAIAQLISQDRVGASFYPAITVSHIHPGHGVEYANCGEFLGWQDTLDGCKSSRTPRFRSCDRKECPVCWRGWLRKESAAVAEKTAGKLRALDEHGHGRYGQVHHWQISPPREVVGEYFDAGGDRSILDGWLARALPAAGIRAAACTLHHARLVGGSRGDSPQPPQELWFTANGRLWYHSPHFHVVGCGFFRCEKDQERPAVLRGAVVTTISRDLDQDAMGRLWYYLLDHTAVRIDGGRELSIRYFGDFHSSKVASRLVETSREQKLCDCCGEDVYFFAGDQDPTSGDRWLVPDCEPVPVLAVSKVYHYEVRPRAQIAHPQQRLAVGLAGRPPGKR